MACTGQLANCSQDQPETMESNILSLGTLFQVKESFSLFEQDHESYHAIMGNVAWL